MPQGLPLVVGIAGAYLGVELAEVGFGLAFGDVDLPADRREADRAADDSARAVAEAAEEIVDETAVLTVGVGLNAGAFLVVACVEVAVVHVVEHVVAVCFARVAGRRVQAVEDPFAAVAEPARQGERRDLAADLVHRIVGLVPVCGGVVAISDDAVAGGQQVNFKADIEIREG